jgi:uncharacterized protein (DUF58 family)
MPKKSSWGGRLRARIRKERRRGLGRNFTFSILSLTVAMLAALYSSSATRDGRMWAAGISATIALAISLWVSLRFVPGLARSVDLDWIPFLFHYRVTREGWIYFGSLAVVVFAAINTNNNLLYMVLSALLAVLLLSGFLSGVNFRGVDIRVRMPATCFVGESFPISIEVRNIKAVFPTFSLKLGPADEHGAQFEPVYLTCIRANETDSRVSFASLHRRGRYRISKVKMTSRYPFGFLSTEKDRASTAECICYPEIVAKEQLNFAAIDLLGANQRFERGPGNDLYMIRDYLPSDSARHVHWKASAKTAVLKTREFAAEEIRRVTLYLDRQGREDQNADFESLVSHAASIAFHLVRDGVDVALNTDEWTSGFGGTQKHLEAILSYLALVERSTEPVGAAGKADAAMVLSLRNATFN